MGGTGGEGRDDIGHRFLVAPEVRRWLDELSPAAEGAPFENLDRLVAGTLEEERFRKVPEVAGLYEIVTPLPHPPEAPTWPIHRITVAVHDDGVHHLLSHNSEGQRDPKYIARAETTMRACCLR